MFGEIYIYLMEQMVRLNGGSQVLVEAAAGPEIAAAVLECA